MKHFLLIMAFFMASLISAYAQDSSDKEFNLQPGLKYRALNDYYDPSDYQKTPFDDHSPALSGVASFFIPGLGQMINGEVGRGLAWMGAAAGTYFVTSAATIYCLLGAMCGSSELFWASAAFATIGLGALITIDVIQIIDAVNIAKVKNMYEMDLIKSQLSDAALDINLYPSISRIPTATGTRSTAELTLAFNF